MGKKVNKTNKSCATVDLLSDGVILVLLFITLMSPSVLKVIVAFTYILLLEIERYKGVDLGIKSTICKLVRLRGKTNG